MTALPTPATLDELERLEKAALTWAARQQYHAALIAAAPTLIRLAKEREELMGKLPRCSEYDCTRVAMFECVVGECVEGMRYACKRHRGISLGGDWGECDWADLVRRAG